MAVALSSTTLQLNIYIYIYIYRQCLKKRKTTTQQHFKLSFTSFYGVKLMNYWS